jgi:hypothetical protein
VIGRCVNAGELSDGQELVLLQVSMAKIFDRERSLKLKYTRTLEGYFNHVTKNITLRE